MTPVEKWPCRKSVISSIIITTWRKTTPVEYWPPYFGEDFDFRVCLWKTMQCCSVNKATQYTKVSRYPPPPPPTTHRPQPAARNPPLVFGPRYHILCDSGKRIPKSLYLSYYGFLIVNDPIPLSPSKWSTARFWLKDFKTG